MLTIVDVRVRSPAIRVVPPTRIKVTTTALPIELAISVLNVAGVRKLGELCEQSEHFETFVPVRDFITFDRGRMAMRILHVEVS